MRHPRLNGTSLPNRSPAQRAAPCTGRAGKVLGGSSSIDGMLLRARQPSTNYDRWARMGCSGWTVDVLPRSSNNPRAYGGGGDDRLRGRSGPTAVPRSIAACSRRPTHSACTPRRKPSYRARRITMAPCRRRVGSSQNSRRVSRFAPRRRARFLAPARRRANLRVETDAPGSAASPSTASAAPALNFAVAIARSFRGRRARGNSVRGHPWQSAPLAESAALARPSVCARSELAWCTPGWV